MNKSLLTDNIVNKVVNKKVVNKLRVDTVRLDKAGKLLKRFRMWPAFCPKIAFFFVLFFFNSVIKSCDSPDWLVHTCYRSASSRVTEAKFLTQKCFSVENLIIVSLNTVISIIVIS